MWGEVTLYGEDSAWDTKRLRSHLDTLGVPYRFVAVRTEDAEQALARGERAAPTVEMKSGRTERRLGAPNETALDEALKRLGLLPAA